MAAGRLDGFNREIVALERDFLQLIRGHLSLAELRTKESLKRVWEEIDRDPVAAVCMTRIKSGHAMTPRHGINVMLLARAWTNAVHQLGRRRDDFSFCALIHDLGHWHPDDLVHVFGAYTHSQARLLAAHTRVSAWREAVLDNEMVQWIEEHHEQPNGRGYPTGTTEPTALSQVLRIADCFDGLTTPRRIRPTYSQHEALIVMGRWAGHKFSKGLFQGFLRFMGRYPLGTFVELKDGRRAVMAPGELGPQPFAVTNCDGDVLNVDDFDGAPHDTIHRELKHWYWRVPDDWCHAHVRPDLLDLPRSYLDEKES
ncbi:MAG: HD domain-containing protein [Acidobacteria bacterium]|nr:HD domain-containing protein [Acidobacteriota bacterium]